MLLDTGASINVINESKMENITLQKTDLKAFAYDSDKQVTFVGKFEVVVESKDGFTLATFYVANSNNSGNLSCLSTAQELELISLTLNKLSSEDANLTKIFNKHANIF